MRAELAARTEQSGWRRRGGVISFGVAQRRHEMAVRLARGVTRGQLVGGVVRQGTLLAAAGVLALAIVACLVPRPPLTRRFCVYLALS